MKLIISLICFGAAFAFGLTAIARFSQEANLMGGLWLAIASVWFYSAVTWLLFRISSGP